MLNFLYLNPNILLFFFIFLLIFTHIHLVGEESQNSVVLSCRLGLNRGSSFWLPKVFEVTTDVIGKGWVEFIPASAL